MTGARVAALGALFTPRRGAMLEDLRALVERESPSDDADRVTALARFVAARAARPGVRAETVPCAGRGEAFRARVGDESADARGTLLLGHLDTVWPAGTLAEMPFRLTDGIVTGPGVFDMKGGVATALAVLDAVAAGEVRPAGPLTLLFTGDEEIGSWASRDLLVAEARRHARVLVLEPSGESGAAKIARKGIGLVEATFHGIASHAGLEPEKGASALAELARYVVAAGALGNAAAGTSVVPTVAAAGTKTNVVPERATVSVDFRFFEAREGERVAAALAGWAPADPRVRFESTGGVNRPPMEPTVETTRLFEVARRVADALGFELSGARVGGASDGNLTAAAGTPTLDGLGPRGAGAHARHERLEADDLPRRAALVAALVETP